MNDFGALRADSKNYERNGQPCCSRLLRLKLYFLKYEPLRSVAVRRRARRLGAPVQELPNVYKLVHLYCLPLTRTARPVVVPYECGTHPRRRARTRKGYAASVTLLRRERLR